MKRKELTGMKTNYLAAVLFAAGAICLLICFTHNTMSYVSALSEISGVLMISGLVIFLKNLKKLPEDTKIKSDISVSANEAIKDCEKILSEVKQHIYGDEDDGKEEISFVSEKLGKFIYRRKPQWYEASCKWCGTEIKVILTISEDYVSENFISRLEMIFENQKGTDRILRKMACTELDVIKKKRKCPDDLLTTKSSVFAKRLIPCNLFYVPDEGFSLNYVDDATKSDCEVVGYLSEDGMVDHVVIENAVSSHRI